MNNKTEAKKNCKRIIFVLIAQILLVLWLIAQFFETQIVREEELKKAKIVVEDVIIDRESRAPDSFYVVANSEKYFLSNIDPYSARELRDNNIVVPGDTITVTYYYAKRYFWEYDKNYNYVIIAECDDEVFGSLEVYYSGKNFSFWATIVTSCVTELALIAFIVWFFFVHPKLQANEEAKLRWTDIEE